MEALGEAYFRNGIEKQSGLSDAIEEIGMVLKVQREEIVGATKGEKALQNSRAPQVDERGGLVRLARREFIKFASISGNKDFGTTTAFSMPTSPQVT